jgi:threonine synthase
MALFDAYSDRESGETRFAFARPVVLGARQADRSMWRFRERFPIDHCVPPVSLGEGGTPLIASHLMSSGRLFWKDETRNPTGSHKDRALSLAATDARSCGARVMAVVSAGSTGLSSAAYARRAGLASLTLMGRGAQAERVYPVFAMGSRLIAFDTGIDAVIAALNDMNGIDGLYVCSTTRAANAVQAEAPKTIAYEIVEDLGRAPDWVIVPTGGGGTIAGIGQGFRDLLDGGLINRLPHLVAVVPTRYAALREALTRDIRKRDAYFALPYRDDVATALTKLSHAHPPDGLAALDALRESDGLVLAFDDDAAIEGVAEIGAADGLYLEPSSAIVAPAVKELWRSGHVRDQDIVVALACGSGFRETFVTAAARPLRRETATLADLPRLIGLAWPLFDS